MKLRFPDRTEVVFSNSKLVLNKDLTFDGGYVRYSLDEGITVNVKSENKAISFIHLYWSAESLPDVKVLGDAWERGYGDFEWKPICASRNMPWYFAIFIDSLNYQFYFLYQQLNV